MSANAQWLRDFDPLATNSAVDGLVPVRNYDPNVLAPEQVVAMEKAAGYTADAVFFEASRNGQSPVPQAFIYASDGPSDDPEFGEMHRRIWSWGGVPLIYRKARGIVQLFRCAHKPDFISPTGVPRCKPFKQFEVLIDISSDPWWDSAQLRNGTLWDDPDVCKKLLSPDAAAHRRLFNAVRSRYQDLIVAKVLPVHLSRKLLILSILIAYLEERRVLLPDFFATCLDRATTFFQVLANGDALVSALAKLETQFNGNVFTLSDADRELLITSNELDRFAKFVEGTEEVTGQLSLWKLYSFKDLPVELISNIYQLFVKDNKSSVYTPPFVVRLMLDEILSPERLTRIMDTEEVILDPSCGSGVFLVEAYKRLVLHWRRNHNWRRPDESVLKELLAKVCGIDKEPGAVELAAFSLYVALCDALEPDDIRSSIKLFPPLIGTSIHQGCFFDCKVDGLVKDPVGALVGNPPFESELTTAGAERSYERYQSLYGRLPDKQLAYLFLHEAMEMVAYGGVLCLLQQYSFLYNQNSLAFRRKFISDWDVREILDFVSVRGLFQKGSADTKVIVVIAEAATPSADRHILHATFRRNGRVGAEQRFDIDYYDLNWLPRRIALINDEVWRSNLLGGARAFSFVNHIKEMSTIEQYAQSKGWDYGEGFIEGKRGIARPADHIIGKPLLRSKGLTSDGIDVTAITIAPNKAYEGPRSEGRFTPPILLISEHMNIYNAIWDKSYLTYTQRIVGFPVPLEDIDKIMAIREWLVLNERAIKAYIALTSPSLFIQRATAVQADDIYSIPYVESGSLDLSTNEQILVDDIVEFYRDFIRLGDDAMFMSNSCEGALPAFAEVFTRQINTIYKANPLRAVAHYSWAGIICQPFAFGEGEVDWSGVDELKGKLDRVLQEKGGESLNITRIARLYDGNFMFLLKPDKLRYWLRSIALRDADETLADLRAQGF